MGKIELNHITKTYEKDVTAVKDFNLEIEDGEFIVLVGPSGCGKSTMLRMIAGLEEITDGEFKMDGRLMNDIPPKNRDIAMVFQNYALYPHMSVYDNMAFALKMRKFKKEEIRRRVTEAAKVLGLEEYLKRKPRALSGGQRQRVALGRAIVRDAKLFLMDEPLSNLDAKLRFQMRAEISKLHHRLKTTTVYVTHDQTEAMTMATRIVIMKDGVIQQVGSPKEVYDFPANQFVGGFIGSPAMNFFEGLIEDGAFVTHDGIRLALPSTKAQELKSAGYTEGTRMTMGIRPENVTLQPPGFSGESLMPIESEVIVSELTGAETLLYSKLGDQDLIARIDSGLDLRTGDKVTLAYDMELAHFFDSASGERLRLGEDAGISI
ncbi:ABC transporter ATP-binding protein [Edaphobacillus lindanitolerans]|uniref:Carbohydrate ABC transporter ATP-binding protein, CUT1 family n=1 Tax=Edaphobacillus lindanitolerans TaxID=550447 RepID=A0A1U7PRG0_9BACI|nr:sn-glycerol-3-phosphate ABC transporter ATP-binding protein UgpC [Edaphobacillus lindanitolerans]SIT87272.1 carbohydrate ABC transporter ATP-binding protein, CUT1 family [Edaphobacillus lindanitolerans]